MHHSPASAESVCPITLSLTIISLPVPPSDPKMDHDPTRFVSYLRERRLGLCDLPVELLIRILSLLYGQDIARCIRVSVIIFVLQSDSSR